MANPAARPEKPTDKPAPRWTKPLVKRPKKLLVNYGGKSNNWLCMDILTFSEAKRIKIN